MAVRGVRSDLRPADGPFLAERRLGFVVYAWLNNRMMSCIEGKVYGDPKPPKDS